MRSFMAFCAFLMLSVTVAFPSAVQHVAANLPVNFDRVELPQSAAMCPMDVIDGNPEAVRLGFYNPPVEYLPINVNGLAYTAISMSGEASSLDEGSPEVPRVNRVIMVSPRGEIGLRITSQNYRVESLENIPAPFVGLMSNADLESMENPVNENIYSRNEWYPAEIATISSPAALRDVRFVALNVYPVQVNPVTRQVRIYDQIEVAIENLGGTGAGEIEIIPRSLTPDFKALYQMIPNFPGSELDALPVVPGKQLYICVDNATVNGLVQTLVDWRRKKGIDAVLATTTTIGGSTAAQIRTYIQNQYTASGGTLESVCLIGDPGASAPYQLASGSSLDNFYGALTGGPNVDPVPDIAVGRFPVENSTQLSAMVSKTIKYESDPSVADTSWFNRGWCAAHNAQIASNPSMKQYTRQLMLNYGIETVNWNVYGSDFPGTDATTRVNEGICVFNHRLSWVGEMSTTDLSGLNNGQKNPFVMAISCATGSFEGGGEEISEAWVRRGTSTNPVGAIGCVGMSGLGTHVAENNIVDGGAMHGLFSLGLRQQGMALVTGKFHLYKAFAGFDDGAVANFCAWANLMGDPGVELFLDPPRPVVVTRPASIHLNTNNVAVQVNRDGSPLANALVGLVKGTETFARGYTNAAGQVNLTVSTPTTGYMYLTITGKRVDTVLDSIIVIDAAATLSLNSLTVDDDNVGGTIGDGNGILNPGETVDLNIRLQNSGTSSTATGVNGTLASSSTGIVVTTANSSYPDIAIGANAAPLTNYRIQVTQVFNAEPVTLMLAAVSSAGTQNVRVDLTPVAGDAAFVSSAFPDGNNRLDPGDAGTLNITMRNSGSRNLVSASGILRSLDAHVTVSDSLGTFGAVAAGATATTTGNPFAVTANIQTVGGYRASLLLIITDTGGFRDSIQFSQTIGVVSTTTPTGPDAYGYYAYDNTETQPVGSASIYQWVEIITNSLGTSMGFNDDGEDQDDYGLRTLPFDFQFYGQTFTQVTISSNGWLAFGQQDMYDARNYPIPYALGPTNLVAAYWDDLVTTGIANPGVYTYDDVANGRFIVQWRTRGMCSNLDEVFEIILLNPDVYPSPTGDGKILVQYQTLNSALNCGAGTNDNEYATLGIQNFTHTIGIQYAYWNVTDPTAASLSSGRAIMYTTDLNGFIPQNLTLTGPNGGETLYLNSSASVTWIPNDLAGFINIELSRTGVSGPWTSLAANTPDDGSFNWTVSGAESQNCRIKITSTTDPLQADTSAGSFSIKAITLLAPNGGEAWFVDSTVTINWQSSLADNIKIEISRNGLTGPWIVLDPGTANDGSFSWVVTTPQSAACRIRVSALLSPTQGDSSNGDFSIGSIQFIMNENFETGGPGWTHTNSGGTWIDQWHISTELAQSGINSYKCGDTGTGDYSDLNDALLISPVIANLPTGSNLSFSFQLISEISGAWPADSAYDGGLLEISADGGPFTQVVPEPQYDHWFRLRTSGNRPYNGPLPGVRCFAGTYSTWTAETFDLSAFAGQDIQMRFRFCSDSSTVREGWYIDDVQVYGAVVAPPLTNPIAATISMAASVLTIRWGDDDNPIYNVYSSANLDGPYDTLVGTTTGHSLIVPGGPAASRRFYQVVGSDGN